MVTKARSVFGVACSFANVSRVRAGDIRSSLRDVSGGVQFLGGGLAAVQSERATKLDRRTKYRLGFDDRWALAQLRALKTWLAVARCCGYWFVRTFRGPDRPELFEQSATEARDRT
jgi:hypothetical protein